MQIFQVKFLYISALWIIFLFISNLTLFAQDERDAKDVVLLIDNSASMKKSDPNRLSEEFAKAVIEGFMEPWDHIAVAQFSDKSGFRFIVDWETPDSPGSIKRIADKIKPVGGNFSRRGAKTDYVYALDAALASWQAQPERNPQLIVILLTDGKLDINLSDYNGTAKSSIRHRWKQTISNYRSNKAPIFCMGFGDDIDSKLLKKFANETKFKDENTQQFFWIKSGFPPQEVIKSLYSILTAADESYVNAFHGAWPAAQTPYMEIPIDKFLKSADINFVLPDGQKKANIVLLDAEGKEIRYAEKYDKSRVLSRFRVEDIERLPGNYIKARIVGGAGNYIPEQVDISVFGQAVHPINLQIDRLGQDGYLKLRVNLGNLPKDTKLTEARLIIQPMDENYNKKGMETVLSSQKGQSTTALLPDGAGWPFNESERYPRYQISCEFKAELNRQPFQRVLSTVIDTDLRLFNKDITAPPIIYIDRAASESSKDFETIQYELYNTSLERQRLRIEPVLTNIYDILGKFGSNGFSAEEAKAYIDKIKDGQILSISPSQNIELAPGISTGITVTVNKKDPLVGELMPGNYKFNLRAVDDQGDRETATGTATGIDITVTIIAPPFELTLEQGDRQYHPELPGWSFAGFKKVLKDFYNTLLKGESLLSLFLSIFGLRYRQRLFTAFLLLILVYTFYVNLSYSIPSEIEFYRPANQWTDVRVKAYDKLRLEGDIEEPYAYQVQARYTPFRKVGTKEPVREERIRLHSGANEKEPGPISPNEWSPAMNFRNNVALTFLPVLTNSDVPPGVYESTLRVRVNNNPKLIEVRIVLIQDDRSFFSKYWLWLVLGGCAVFSLILWNRGRDDVKKGFKKDFEIREGETFYIGTLYSTDRLTESPYNDEMLEAINSANYYRLPHHRFQKERFILELRLDKRSIDCTLENFCDSPAYMEDGSSLESEDFYGDDLSFYFENDGKERLRINIAHNNESNEITVLVEKIS